MVLSSPAHLPAKNRFENFGLGTQAQNFQIDFWPEGEPERIGPYPAREHPQARLHNGCKKAIDAFCGVFTNVTFLVWWEVMDRFKLDFDDAYQYCSAEKYHLTLVSFDGDFDRTDRGRMTPEHVR